MELNLQQINNGDNKFVYKKQNSHTYGKQLRKLNELYQQDNTANLITFKENQKILNYLDYCLKNGLILNKVALAEFTTENGFKYEGFVALEDIYPNEIVLKVPQHLILATRDAFLSEIMVIFQDNQQFFTYAPDHKSIVEYRMIITFLLFELQKKENSKYFMMIDNLPKCVDIAMFWSDEELSYLEDKSLKDSFKEQNIAFKEQYQQFSQIMRKYPNLFDGEESFSYEKYQFFYIHLVSRSFGGLPNYQCMVSIAEMFNHENTSVIQQEAYEESLLQSKHTEQPNIQQKQTCLQYEEEKQTEIKENKLNTNQISDSINQIKQQFQQQENLQINNFDDYSSSESSVDSQDIETDDEVDYKFEKQVGYQNNQQDQDDAQKRENENTRSENNTQIQQIKEEFKKEQQTIIQWMVKNLDMFQYYPIIIFGKVLKELQNTEKIFNLELQKIQLLKSKKKIQMINNTFQNFKNDLENQLKLIKEFDQTAKTMKNKKPEDAKHSTLREARLNDLDSWKNNNFQFFELKIGKNDYFKKGSQVYFCYGRHSNRSLLENYGIALKNNKHDSVHFRVNIVPDILSSAPMASKYLHLYDLSKYIRFKLNYSKFNHEIILYARSLYTQINFNKDNVSNLFQNYDLEIEIQALKKVQQLYEQFLNTKFQLSIEENEKLLKSPQLSGNQYFAIVYKLERQKIVTHQLNLIKKAQDVIQFHVNLQQRKSQQNELNKTEEFKWDLYLKNIISDQEQYNRTSFLLHQYFQSFKQQQATNKV